MNKYTKYCIIMFLFTLTQSVFAQSPVNTTRLKVDTIRSLSGHGIYVKDTLKLTVPLDSAYYNYVKYHTQPISTIQHLQDSLDTKKRKDDSIATNGYTTRYQNGLKLNSADTTGKWMPIGSGGVNSSDSLGHKFVDTTGLSAGKHLVFNGTEWVLKDTTAGGSGSPFDSTFVYQRLAEKIPYGDTSSSIQTWHRTDSLLALYLKTVDIIDTAHTDAKVTKITAGTNVTISPTSGLGNVTINATGGGTSAALFEIDLNGNLVPTATGTVDNYWEVDGDGNLIPKVI